MTPPRLPRILSRARLGLLLAVLTAGAAAAEQATVWIGTTTNRDGESKGIYRATLDLDSGSLSEPMLATEISSPGFLAFHPNGRILYAVCSLPDGGGGGVAAFRIGDDATLEPLNTQPIGDGGAAHLAVDRTGRCLFTAQYGGGSVAAFPLADDGSIRPRSDLQEHEGSGPNRDRQEAPHPHWVGTDPANRFLFVPDLGIDRVVVYRMDLEHGTLARHGTGTCPAGAGPRHFTFHPDGKSAFVLNELALSVTAFRFDPEAGALEPSQTISTLPEPLREIPNKASEIRVHPNGRFLYAANRGHDSITVFAVDPDTRRLTFVEHEAIRGSWPRHFNLDPSGRWLLAAGRNSNSISIFRVDPESGGLVFTGSVVHAPTPICIAFAPPRSTP